ncbi:MAG: sensor histidine kinase [Anaerostipes sp.]|jgi:sensor histidine kinase regulating citrate/malate metabolism
MVKYESILIIAIVLLAFYEVIWFVRKKRNQRIQEQNQILEAENMLMMEYYDTLKHQLDKTRKFHHDLNKHINVLKELSEYTIKNEKIKTYTKEMEDTYEEYFPIMYCSNPVINALLVNKVKRCHEKEIKIDIKMKGFTTGTIKEIDLVALFANVIDNAMEECERIEGDERKKIAVKCDVQAGNLLFQVTNPTDKNVINKRTLITEKKDKFSHGIGTKIIKDVVNKYEGYSQIDLEHGTFKMTVQLPVVKD